MAQTIWSAFLSGIVDHKLLLLGAIGVVRHSQVTKVDHSRSPKKRGTPGSAVAERRSGRGGSKSENSTPVQSPAKKAKTAKAAAAAATAQPTEDLDLDVEEVEKSVKKEKDDVEEEEPVEDLDDSFDESEMERDITEAATAFVDVGAPIEDDGSPPQEQQQEPPQIMARPSPKKRLNFDDPPPKVGSRLVKVLTYIRSSVFQ